MKNFCLGMSEEMLLEVEKIAEERVSSKASVIKEAVKKYLQEAKNGK